MSKDCFGDRIKEFEMAEAGRKFTRLLPIVARLDGKCFSKFTKGLERPYDSRMSDLMIATTKYLIKETNAVMGYTQSDEITLAWYSDSYKSQIYYDGRIQKMIGDLSAAASVYFNAELPNYLPTKAKLMPRFDARVWQMPTLKEAANVFLWRELDATKNSISMAASTYYSHKFLMHKTGNEKQELLHQKGIDWNDYPPFFKHGTFVAKTVVTRSFTSGELTKLSPKHQAKNNSNLQIERSEITTLDMPPFSTVTNRVGVIFFGEAPTIGC